MMPVTSTEIAKETKQDKEMLPLLRELLSGISDDRQAASAEFSLESGCIMRGTRVYMKQYYRNYILVILE